MKILLIVLMIAVLIESVFAIPTFHQFYGEVKCHDGNNTDNKILMGIVNESLNIIEIIQGRYGYDPLFIVEDGNDNDIILFRIENTEVGTYIFEDGSATNLNFEVNDSICFVPENPAVETNGFLELIFRIIIFAMIVALIIVIALDVLRRRK